MKELIQQANSQIVICLVGNKADMASESRSVTKEVGCFTSLNCNSKNIADINRPTVKGNKQYKGMCQVQMIETPHPFEKGIILKVLN